jgi:p-aminobenzoyl-glutamate transporter AbgT
MKGKKLFHIYARVILAFFIAGIILILFSWFANIYGMDVRNLLSADGLRWLLRNSFKQVRLDFPFLSFLTLCMSCGVIYKSGWFSAILMTFMNKRQSLSYKQRWGLQLSSFVLIFYLLVLIVGLFSPNGELLGLTGNLENSPIVEGFAIWFSFGICSVCFIYSWISGIMKHPYEVVHWMIYGVKKAAPLLVLLIIALFFIELCNYVF